MSNKTLLIVERSENKLNLISEGEDKYVLEGTFTEIGVKNNNNRIYDEKEILPHVNELKKQCENNKLLGELDHPKSFDISLKNASHVIESIDYDPSTKKVTGRIRLLNTDAGKNARALVDAGVPLHISSRAAGVVESNGHVKIKKMFTYDLVANPGFSNAELKRVNESYGFDAEDDNIGLFEVPDFWTFASNKIAENKENNIEPENKKINEMDAKKYISVEDFNEYTKIIKNEFENLKTSVQEASSNKEDKSLNEGLVKYAESIAKKVNSIQEHIGRLTENVDGLVSHNDYIIENLEKVKNYAELVGEKTNVGINYSEQLAESMDHLIEYTKMVAEKTNESINYTQYLGEKTSSLIDFSNYLSEETSNRWGYQTHINEQLDKVISHNDYIVEGVDSVVKYSEYLKENTENLSNYLNFVVEQINEGASIEDIKKSTDIITEKAKEVVQISESLEVDNNDDFKSDITNQLNAILESAKTEKEIETDKKYHFFQFLGETKRREFDSLNAETQEKIVNAFQTNRYYGTADANKIWEGCFIQPTKRADWLLQMPSRYLASWNTLTESQKNSIKAQASTRLLESQYQIDNFWATRDLREVKVDLINENENLNAPIDESSDYKTPDTYMDSVRAGFRQRFKK
jgi:methyl-accepting chemotaxis protein